MSRCSRSTEVREQRSVFYFMENQAGELPRQFDEMYPNMFIQDVSQGLLPTWTRRHDSKVIVAVEPTTDEDAKYLCRAIDISNENYSSRKLDAALSEFLRLTMVELCLARRVVFEIAYIRPKSEEPYDRFELFHINSRQIVERRGNLYQVVPPNIAKERGVDELIALPRETLAVFTLPNKLGRSVSAAMEALSALSDHRWQDLVMEAQDGRLPYEFSTHERSMRLALAEAVRDIGWSARGSFNDKTINYYLVRQELRFKLFELEVRESLLAQLNAVLQRTGSVLGRSWQLTVTGLPTRSDLEGALKQLALGKMSFKKVMDSVRGY